MGNELVMGPGGEVILLEIFCYMISIGIIVITGLGLTWLALKILNPIANMFREDEFEQRKSEGTKKCRKK